jgi:ribokinase
MSVIVIGNVTVDLSYEVKKLPCPGETLLARSRMVDAGGKGLNQAIAASRTGTGVDFIAPAGDDLAAGVIRKCLASERFRVIELFVAPFPTDESIILVASDGLNAIVSTDSAAKWLTVETVAPFWKNVRAGDTLLLQGNLSRKTTKHCLKTGFNAGVRTVLNPSPIDFSYVDIWPSVHTVVVNEIEAEQLSGEKDPEKAGLCFLNMGLETVIVTLGSEGAIAMTKGLQVAVAAPKVTAVDTVGAGDVFVGSFVAALDLGLSLRQSLDFAVEAASLSVTRRGTTVAFPSAKEMSELLELKRNVKVS